MEQQHLAHAVQLALKAAEAAAAGLRHYFHNIGEARISTKSNAADLVSNADVEAEAVIREILLGGMPEAGFLGEESAATALTGHDLLWIVDPLDGTSNFLCGLGLWSISIALCTAQRQPLAGVVMAPELGRTWHAARGGGCFCNGQPCHARSLPPGGGMHNAMLATGFPYAVATGLADINLNNFAHMQRRFHKIRRLGSAAIDLAFVAQGVFDGMWELQLQPWDCAAGLLLVTEAGGCASRFDGSAFTPGDADLLAAGSPELLALLAQELSAAAG